MQTSIALFNTTVGKKAALALSGLVLFGFVLGHLLGNLLVFAGPEAFNGYAESIKGNALLLWGTRVLLLISVVAHVALSIDLYTRSLGARRVAYRVKHNIATSYAASAMKYSGPALLLYILFHLAHFTAPGLSLGPAQHSATDVYGNFVSSFSVPWVVGVYVLANLFLGMHLYHGSWSLFQSLGLSHPRYDRLRKRACVGLALGITIGNVILPLSVLAGLVR
ncbi:MAG TPA: succinate dehydrogenase cytochrome b subunit [Polyangiaceae bacterium]